MTSRNRKSREDVVVLDSSHKRAEYVVIDRKKYLVTAYFRSKNEDSTVTAAAVRRALRDTKKVAPRIATTVSAKGAR